MKNNTD